MGLGSCAPAIVAEAVVFGDEVTTSDTPTVGSPELDQVGDCGGGTAAIRCGRNGDVGDGDWPSPCVGAYKVEAEDVLSAAGGRLDFAWRSGTRETDTTTLPRSLTTESTPIRGVGTGSVSQLVPAIGGVEMDSERATECDSPACVSPCEIGKLSEDGAGDLLTSPLIQLLR